MTKLAACLLSVALLTACGGDDTSGDGGDTSAGAGGGGGEGGGGPTTVNGCSSAAAEDRTADASLTITATSDFKYMPACVKIKSGTTVTFEMDLAVHPLVGGTYEQGIGTPDDASPISATSAGNMATFNISPAGAYGFYCDIHASIGMVGAVHAVD